MSDSAVSKKRIFCRAADLKGHHLSTSEAAIGATKKLRPGLVNFVIALDYHFCLNLPAAFTKPGRSPIVVPCRACTKGSVEVDPNTRGQENSYMPEHGQKYWHYFARMVNHPKGWPLLYRVTALNMTRIWIEWAGRLAFGCKAKLSLSGLRFMPSPSTLQLAFLSLCPSSPTTASA